MTDHKVPANKLASLVNTALASLEGTYGTTTERAVFRWLSGETRWPLPPTRAALEHITGLTCTQLGFRPKDGTPSPPAPEEDPVYRRAFIAAASAAGATLATPANTAPRRLGSGDVARLNAKLAAVVSMDDRYGGTPELEAHATALTTETLDLQQNGTSSARVRSELYAVAAAFITSAMWAAIDGRRLDAAQGHLNHAVTLAGLAGDPAVQFRVWGHASVLYRQLGRHTDAMAAAEASRATGITRRDPMYASLALARLAVDHADLGDTRTALRTLGQAQDAFDRADPTLRRPPWMRFYDRAELDSLALFTHLQLGRWDEAEHHAHRSLAYLRPDLHRNRALTHANLALAQLGQGELEPALATAQTIPPEMARKGRIGKLLSDFTRRMTDLAPGSAGQRTWTEHRKAQA
ncbi:Tat pathway signal protein [Actinacidiphila oryziradicis]|uniref:Tat pathway signal protein n=2 Tax=Actinacidiphila oryziradicis TaxID=2571141 RepID=A0A4V6WJC2_9ACTN|nr:Tat pathway signal protein [Actinacidiphila oryziradicis]